MPGRTRGSRSGVAVCGAAVVVMACISAFAPPLFADDALPPWGERTDVPLPPWARSVSPNKPESAIYAEPGKMDLRR